ncbi:MAG: hypothetical protein GXY32_01955 [Ruminococcaceae bacterium]|nr:hypothetical protein [Oscillospiraceae bacterium]
MDAIGQISTLLEQKKALFLEYEQATRALLDCEVDAVEKYITERGKKAIEIDALTEEIARLSSDVPAGELLREATLARIDFADLPPEFHDVFYDAQAVRSVAYRISELDKQVVTRLESLRDEAMAQIKQNQNMPKIKKYLTSLSDKPPAGSLSDGKA